jgi:hypothetical protein
MYTRRKREGENTYRDRRNILFEPRWTGGRWDILGNPKGMVTVGLTLTLVPLLFCRALQRIRRQSKGA